MIRDVHAIGVIARHVVQTAARQRVLAGLALGTLAVAWTVLELRAFHFGGGEQRFVADLGVAALTVGGLAVAVALTLDHLGGDNGRRAALGFLPKAVSHGAFVLGHFGGVLAVSAGFCGLMSGVLGFLLVRAGAAGETVPWFTLVQVGTLQAMKLGVVGAMVALVTGMVRNGALAALLSLLIVIAGQLRGVLDSLPEHADDAGWLVSEMIRVVVPDLALFDRGRALAEGAAIVGSDFAWLAAYAGLYAAAYLAAALLVYRRREL